MLDIKQIESFYPKYLRQFKRNLLREYLQYKILEIIFSSDYGNKLSFMGGTAIHIIHSNTRFSEDLDFDNLGLDKKDFEKLSAFIQRRLRLEGYDIEAETSFKGAFRLYVGIKGLLYENGLSYHKREKLFIYIDMEPQNFSYHPDKIILNKFGIFSRINVVPLDILLAQKLYAIFMRKRAMGRDFYDTIFLFGRTRPNIEYLRKKMKIKDMADLKSRILRKCDALNFKNLVSDVEQFLFMPEDAKKILLFPEYIKKI
ncbi:MAG: nucleotidyl transferase AbiEii/AbiGii toxin family protein [Candidatus Omnitrophica bacterium]|nr:nucleotidyl transferase AbiEii/AbiGii toxin family protein [Candidatus Omnitrophota bacterium]